MKSNYYILGYVDKPCWKLLAKRINGKYQYVYINRPPFEYPNAIPIEDFGITVTVIEHKTFFKKDRPSVAKYSSGNNREWQDVFFHTITKRLISNDMVADIQDNLIHELDIEGALDIDASPEIITQIAENITNQLNDSINQNTQWADCR